MVKRHKELLQDPVRLLETEEGQQVLEEAKEEIIEIVRNNLLQNMVGYIKVRIFDEFKAHFMDLMYDAIDKMLEGHWVTLNDGDRRILAKAVDKNMSIVVNVLHLDREIERDVEKKILDTHEIENEVNRTMQRVHRRACEKTRVFSCVLLLMVMIIVILYKKGYSSPYPIRMLL